MTGLELALLDAQEALDRPKVRADLERLHEAALPLLDEHGEPTAHDLAELLLPGVLETPGNVALFGRLVASSRRVYDSGPPPCPAAGTGAEVARVERADLQAGAPPSLSWEAALLGALAPLVPMPEGVAVHLAIMVEPYMGKVARGEKTIESRWGKVRCAPHGRVDIDDVLVFQRSGGPILGWCVVRSTYSAQLGPGDAAQLIARNQPALGVDDDFAETVADKQWVTLCWLGAYTPIQASHIKTGKNDARGWVVLRGRP